MTDQPHAHLPTPLLQSCTDAILRPRITVLARKAAHARVAAQALGWHLSSVGLCAPSRWRSVWPARGGLYAPRLIVSDELTAETCLADGADFVLSVERRGRGGPLWVEFSDAEGVPRSGLLRRLRAGLLGALWA